MACGCEHENLTLIEDTATCEDDGVKKYQCDNCNEIINEPSLKTGHDYSILVSDTATCTTSGYKTYKCSKCNKTKAEVSTLKSHVYGKDNKCINCGKINPKYPFFELPSLPLSLSSSTTTYSISDIEIATYYYTSDYSYSRSEIILTLTKMYDTKGTNYSRRCAVGYKIYDLENIVIKSGTIYSEDIKVSEKTKPKLTVYSSDFKGGHEYKLVLLNVD